MQKQEEHCLCDECQLHGVPSVITDDVKKQILKEAHAIAEDARRKVDAMIGIALTGRAA